MNELFPLLLLDRDEVTESGESAVAFWLGGFCPATFSFDIEQLAGDDSDSITVEVILGGAGAHSTADGRQRLRGTEWEPADGAEFRANGSSSGVAKTAGQVVGGAGQIQWNVRSGTWRIRVWLQSSPWRGGVPSGPPLDRGNGLEELL